MTLGPVRVMGAGVVERPCVVEVRNMFCLHECILCICVCVCICVWNIFTGPSKENCGLWLQETSEQIVICDLSYENRTYMIANFSKFCFIIHLVKCTYFPSFSFMCQKSSSNNWKIDLCSSYRGNKLQVLTKTVVI